MNWQQPQTAQPLYENSQGISDKDTLALRKLVLKSIINSQLISQSQIQSLQTQLTGRYTVSTIQLGVKDAREWAARQIETAKQQRNSDHELAHERHVVKKFEMITERSKRAHGEGA